MPEYKRAQTDMETYGKQIKDELDAKKKEFETKYQDYMQKMQSGQLSPALQKSKESELQSLDKQYRDFEERVQYDIQDRESKLLGPIYEKIEKSLKDVAETNGYAIVLRSESCYTTVKSNDISDLVLKKMGITPKTN